MTRWCYGRHPIEGFAWFERVRNSGPDADPYYGVHVPYYWRPAARQPEAPLELALPAEFKTFDALELELFSEGWRADYDFRALDRRRREFAEAMERFASASLLELASGRALFWDEGRFP